MKKIVLALAATVCLASCVDAKLGKESVKEELENALDISSDDASDKGKRVTETVSVKPFEKISVAGSFDVHYVQGETTSVKVEGPVKYLRQTVVANDGQTLRIKTKRGVWRSMEDVNVYITSPDLTHVSMAGSGELDAEGMVDTDNLTLELAGSGEIDFKQLVCDNLNIQVAGSGDVDVESVDVNKADMQIAGSGDIKVHFVRADFVSAQVAGSGDIKLSGKAKQVDKKVAGSGDIDTSRLVTQ